MDKSICFIKSVLLGTLIVVFLSGCGKDTAKYVNSEETSDTDYSLNSQFQNDTQAEIKVESSEEQQIYVYVCGAVQNPGVYSMPEGSRICDVFDTAGGLTADAATDYWNQASLLVDGEMIYVPTVKELEERQMSPMDSMGVSEVHPDKEETDGRININTASKEQLMSIPGIGETRADAILSYREENGSFSNVEDIMQVDGIKEGMYEKIKDYIKIN